MKKLCNTEAELKKGVSYKRSVYLKRTHTHKHTLSEAYFQCKDFYKMEFVFKNFQKNLSIKFN